MTILDEIKKEGEKIGIEKGDKKARIETAQKMKQEGLDIKLIAKITELSIEEVKKL